jgi:hypothetical protein
MDQLPKDITLAIASMLPWRYRAKFARVSKMVWKAIRDLMRGMKRSHYNDYIIRNFFALKLGNLPMKLRPTFVVKDVDLFRPCMDIIKQITLIYDKVPPCVHLRISYVDIQVSKKRIAQFCCPYHDVYIVHIPINTPMYVANVDEMCIEIFSKTILPIRTIVSGWMFKEKHPIPKYQMRYALGWGIRKYSDDTISTFEEYDSYMKMKQGMKELTI